MSKASRISRKVLAHRNMPVLLDVQLTFLFPDSPQFVCQGDPHGSMPPDGPHNGFPAVVDNSSLSDVCRHCSRCPECHGLDASDHKSWAVGQRFLPEGYFQHTFLWGYIRWQKTCVYCALILKVVFHFWPELKDKLYVEDDARAILNLQYAMTATIEVRIKATDYNRSSLDHMLEAGDAAVYFPDSYIGRIFYLYRLERVCPLKRSDQPTVLTAAVPI